MPVTDGQYLETGYRHLDWELLSAKELKTSKKAIKKYGYHHHNFVEHAELLQLMRDLYQRKNMVRLAPGRWSETDYLSGTCLGCI